MRALAVTLLSFVVAPAALAAPILGITGSPDRFKQQTAQTSIVHQAFLGWGQGAGYGSPFPSLFELFGPVPMLHLGTSAGGSKTQAITVPQIAAGVGDGYLAALSQAIHTWGKAIYIRPLAEMNNSGVAWYGNPAAYRKAFARIFILVHGGPQVAARLAALHLPPYRGAALASNPAPHVRVLWSPLAGGDDPFPYWPGTKYVDVGGADIYKEAGREPPWSKFDALNTFVRKHHRPFSVPEWGMFSVDDPTFVQQMCTFLKQHPTETEVFYESKPGSIFDLEPKPHARAAYKTCITPLAGTLPGWAKSAVA